MIWDQYSRHLNRSMLNYSNCRDRKMLLCPATCVPASSAPAVVLGVCRIKTCMLDPLYISSIVERQLAECCVVCVLMHWWVLCTQSACPHILWYRVFVVCQWPVYKRWGGSWLQLFQIYSTKTTANSYRFHWKWEDIWLINGNSPLESERSEGKTYSDVLMPAKKTDPVSVR